MDKEQIRKELHRFTNYLLGPDVLTSLKRTSTFESGAKEVMEIAPRPSFDETIDHYFTMYEKYEQKENSICNQ